MLNGYQVMILSVWIFYLFISEGNQFELLLNDIENTSTIPVELPNISQMML